MGPLARSRIRRKCDKCGKIIEVGDEYLNRPATRYKIRCKECFESSQNKWQTDIENFDKRNNQMLALLKSSPRTDEELISKFGNNYYITIRRLISEGHKITSTQNGNSGSITYTLEKEYKIAITDDEQLDFISELDFITINCCLKLLLSNSNEIKLEDDVIKLNSRVGKITIENFNSNPYNSDDFHVFLYKDHIECGFFDNMCDLRDYVGNADNDQTYVALIRLLEDIL